VAFAESLASLEQLNPSDFESSARTALDSYYAHSGVPADYISGGSTERVQVLLDERREIVTEENDSRVVQEVLRVMLRRYDGVADPAAGDVLLLQASDGTRRYKLTENPTESDGQLEWDLEFSRTVTVARGGNSVRPYV